MNSALKFLFLYIFLLISICISAQIHNNTTLDTEKYKNLPKGTVVYSFIDGDSVSHTRIELPDSLKRYIVEFTESPLYTANNRSNLKSAALINNHLMKIDQQHSQFMNDFSRMTGVKTNNLKSQSVSGGSNQIGKEFRKVFNGVSITAGKDLISQIEHLEYVKKVYPDNIVNVVDDESNHVIKADSVWEQYGATGKGVVIGIIDTGIDSTHQDLSNGKVIGGYDFVNNDNDPRDDHGHGTHCAGIAAANGPGLRGVAPDAKLMAIKVLNEWGSGYYSWIIAGIEYALDPDGNPLTDDGVDIISMSLGAPNGDPGDPLSTTVNNAYQKGVLCVIAAGNSGSSYRTISAPGCAHEALTVGASDKGDYITDFSSRGPSLNSYEIKPNILAPGFNIYSSLPNNGYANWNGTSMATPHVAGAVALLKEIHPNWNAQKLRSAIVHSAVDVNHHYDVWTQGNGRMDILKAARVNSTLSTNSINFGLIPNDDSYIERKDTFYVYNLSDKTLNYNLSIPDSFPDELIVSLSTDHFSLGVADSQLVIISLSADNTTLPFPTTQPGAYVGKIIVDDGIQSLNLFFSIIKSHSLKIKFDFEPWCILIHDNISQKNIYYPNGDNLFTLLQSGIYDVIVYDVDRFIVRENVDLSQTQSLEISINEAKHQVEFRGVDPNGIPLQMRDFGEECLVLKGMEGNIFGLTMWKLTVKSYEIVPVVKYFSDFSEKYRYEIEPIVFPHTNSEHQWYSIPFLIDHPIHRDTIIKNDPEDFVTINYYIDNFGNDSDSIYYTRDKFSFGIVGYELHDTLDKAAHILTPPFHLKSFIIPSPDKEFRIDRLFRIKLYTYHSKDDNIFNSLLFIPGYNRCYNDSGKIILENTSLINGTEIKKTADIHLNVSPVFFNQYVRFYPTTKDLQTLKKASHFVDQDFSIIRQKIPIKYFCNSEVILQDTLQNDYNFSRSGEKFHFPVELNKNYKIEIKDAQYQIFKQKGYSSSNYSFNIPSYENSFPGNFSMRSFKITSDGKATNTLRSDKKNRVLLELNASNSKNVVLSIKQTNDPIWKSIYNYQEVEDVGKFSFDIPLSDTLLNGYYSLKLEIKNINNDSSTHLFEPAFYILNSLEIDSMALVDFYVSTNGKEWINNTNWLQTSIKNWFGVVLMNGRVTEINLPENNLTGDIPQSISSLLALNKINLKGNNIENVSGLLSLENLSEIDLSGNKLTFADIEPIMFVKPLVYVPQQKLRKKTNILIEENEKLELMTYLDEEESHYTWYKNDSLLNGFNRPAFVINSIENSDKGDYKCVITNDQVPGLTLETFPYCVQVKPRLFNDRSNLIVCEEVDSRGGSWIDFDNDGDQDLYIVNYRKQNQLLKNMLMETDTVSFVNVTENAIGPGKGASVCSTWGDINNDGNIDVFIVNQEYDELNKLYLNNGNGTFSNFEDPVIFEPIPYSNSASLIDQNRDGWLDLFIVENNKNQLFINQGNLTFSKFSDDLFNIYGNANFANWTDLDNDLDQDIILSRLDGDFFIFNDSDKFIWNSDFFFYSNASSQTSSGGDFDNDGDMDIFCGRGGIDWLRADVDNILFVNNNGIFVPFQDSSLISDRTNYSGSSWGDYDNDGDLDLLGTSFFGKTNLWSNQLQETGKVSFKKVDYGIISEFNMGGRGCCFADYDNDGDLDIFIAGNTFRKHLIENVIGSKNNWINLQCKGTTSNASAIGVKVKVKATINNKPCWQMREISSQTGFSGQNSLNVQFGLGKATIIDSIQVYWPSGIYWDTTGVAVNQFMDIIEIKDIAPVITGQLPFSFNNDGFLKLSLENLIVEDIDNIYPDDFSLIIHDGDRYTIKNDTIVKIDKNKNPVYVPVQVNDGHLSSNVFKFKIDCNLDISDNIFPEIEIFPNPFDDYIKMNFPQDLNIQKVEIFDLEGKFVKSILSENENEYVIDGSQLDQAIYLLKITTKENTVIKKLLKKW